MSNNSNTVLGLLAGTAIGATLGILFAPDKGINTRQRIADEAIATKDKFSEKAMELKDTVVSNVAAKRGSLEEQMESVISDASFKADDVITTLEKKLKDLKLRNKNLQKTS